MVERCKKIWKISCNICNAYIGEILAENLGKARRFAKASHPHNTDELYLNLIQLEDW